MSLGHDDRRIGSRLRGVLERVDGLTAGDLDSIGVLAAAGEWTVALEAPCTQLFEYDVELDDTSRAEIHALGALLDVHVAYLLGDPWTSRAERGDETDGDTAN